METTKVFLVILFLTGISVILYLYYTRKETLESKFNQEQEENIKPVLWYYDPFFWLDIAVISADRNDELYDNMFDLDFIDPVFIPVYLDINLKEEDLTEDNKQSRIDHHKK